jgi:hypothetical protein
MNRCAGPMRVRQTLHQVRVTQTAATRADRQATDQLRLGRGAERAGLLVADLHPLDSVGPPDRVHDRFGAGLGLSPTTP